MIMDNNIRYAIIAMDTNYPSSIISLVGAWHRAWPVAKRSAWHRVCGPMPSVTLGNGPRARLKIVCSSTQRNNLWTIHPSCRRYKLFLLSDLKPLAKSIWNVQGVLVLPVVLQVFVRARLGGFVSQESPVFIAIRSLEGSVWRGLHLSPHKRIFCSSCTIMNMYIAQCIESERERE